MTKDWYLEYLKKKKKKTNSLTERQAKDEVIAQKGSTHGEYTYKKLHRIRNLWS